MHRLAPAQRRVTPVVLLEQEAQLIEFEAGQPVVVEAEIERPLGRQYGPALVQQLTQEGRLAGAPHPDHRVRLAGHAREPGVASGEGKRRDRLESRAQLLGEDGVESHLARIAERCPSVKDTWG